MFGKFQCKILNENRFEECAKGILKMNYLSELFDYFFFLKELSFSLDHQLMETPLSLYLKQI